MDLDSSLLMAADLTARVYLMNEGISDQKV